MRKALRNMTPAEAKAAIVEYFSRPGAVIAMGTLRCMYLTPNGDKCAVGCLIPPSRYRKWFDSQIGLDDVLSSLGVDVDSPLACFLTDAQTAHDEAYAGVPAFLHALKKIKAEDYR